MKSHGNLCLVLHAHLPFVRHPELDDFIEERWLYEAIRESYLPLIRLLARRAAAPSPGPSRLTLSLSPTLMAMLDDALLRGRARRYLERVAGLADRLAADYAGDRTRGPIARYYQHLSGENLATWTQCDGDLIQPFIAAEARGQIELITTTATHAFLPLWKRHLDTTRRQIEVGVAAFRQRIGHDPAGIWLPECGYYPGLENLLEEAGLRYFFLDTHGILNAGPRPRHGVYAPVFCPNGIAAFGRDPESSHQVWSSHGGYPGDGAYREYYRDLGTTLPLDELKAVFPDADLNPSTGFKYHRVTGPGENKEWYDPGLAMEKAAVHARDFLHKKVEQARRLGADMGDTAPVIVAPYDAELFGHWWYEGPLFIEALMEAVDRHGGLTMATPSDVLAGQPTGHQATPAASTWGARGYHDVWLNDATAWMYPHLYRAAERARDLDGLAAKGLSPAMRKRLVAQARRELLLAQSSDWPFMLNAGSHLEYAEKRVRDHLARFYWLTDALEKGIFDRKALAAIEAADNLFDAKLLR
jgi:1,4-alpha-glucan branching enzyme